MFHFKQGDEVIATLNDNVTIKAEVVGKASTGIEQTYILKCTDCTLPNETYPFDTFVMPYSLIKKA